MSIDKESYLNNIKQQDESAKQIFNIEKSEDLLPLSERHYLILNGKLNKISQSSSEEDTFSSVVDKLVKAVISKFQRISGKKLEGKNFLFYIIKKTDKKLIKVLVAISGFGKAGQKGYSNEYEQCKKKLKESIDEIEKEGYNIEGLFVPFSAKEEKNISRDIYHLFGEIIEENLDSFNKDKLVKATLIAKLLHGKISHDFHTIRTISKYVKNIPAFLKAFDNAKKIADEIKKVVCDEIKLVGPLMESLTLDLLNHNLQENKESQHKGTQPNYIQTNAQYLKEQGKRIYFSKNNEDKLENIDEGTKGKYKKSLNKIWNDFDLISNFDIIRYIARCSEDNLIDYLSYKNDIIKEKGIHYIFSIEKGSFDSDGEIPIRPPCFCCILHFPLEFQVIAQNRTGLTTFEFEKRLNLQTDSICDVFNYMSFSDMEKLFIKRSNKEDFFKNDEFMKNKVYGNMRNVLESLISNPEDLNYESKQMFTELLWYASQAGSTDIVKFLFDKTNDNFIKDAIFNLEKKERWTPLHAAVNNGHLETAKALLEHAKTVEEKLGMIRKESVDDGMSPLHLAAYYKRPEIFRLLITGGEEGEDKKPIVEGEKLMKAIRSKPTIPEGGYPTKTWAIYHWEPLFAAIFSSDISTVKFIWTLLRKGGNKPEDLTVNYEESIRMTPLHIAIIRGDYEIAEFLIKEGFLIEEHDAYLSRKEDPEFLFDPPATALNIAIHNGRKEISRLLLENMNEKHAKNTVQAKKTDGLTVLHSLSEYGLDSLIKDKALESELKQYVGNKAEFGGSGDMTPLHVASVYGHKNVVEWLLSNNAPVDEEAQDGFTSLHLAAKVGHSDVVKALLHGKANVNARNKQGVTPLHYAAENGHSEVVKSLLDKGAYFNAEVGKDCTPLKYAKLNKHEDVVQILSSTQDLFDGVKRNDLQKIQEYVTQGAVINAKDNFGCTPLHYSIGKSKNVAKFLLDNGADATQVTDDERNTALHLATTLYSSNKEIVEILIEHVKQTSLDKLSNFINAKTAEGTTSLHVAAKHGYVEVVQLLINNKADPTISNNNGKTALNLTEEKLAHDPENGNLKTIKALLSV